MPLFDANGDLEAFDAGGLRVPVARDGTALVPYRGPASIARTRRRTSRRAPAGRRVRGAIVFVGTSAKGLLDLRSTPLAPDFPGVMIHASLVSGMLDGDMRNVPAGARETVRARRAGRRAIAVFALPWRRPVASVVGIAAIAAAVIGVALFFWFRLNAVIAIAPALSMLALLLVSNLISGFLREADETRALADMFGEYVPPERVRQMRVSGERFTMEGESRR